MIIQKPIICLTAIETFVDRLGWSIVHDLEDGGKAAAEYVVQIYKASKEVGY